MAERKSHYLMFCEAASAAAAGECLPEAASAFRWQATIEEVGTAAREQLSDVLEGNDPQRAFLLSIVRGLEALPGPSRVTLLTSSRSVCDGLQRRLALWRETDYRWEAFGREQPIRNADLWRRIDHALRFHRVDCRCVAELAAVADEQASDEAAADGQAAKADSSVHWDRYRSPDPAERSSRIRASQAMATWPRRSWRAAIGGLRGVAKLVVAVAMVPERCVLAVEAAVLAAWRAFWWPQGQASQLRSM